jgi:hypothetical protein
MYNNQFDLPSEVPCNFNVFSAVFPNVLCSKPTKRRRTNTKNYRQTKLIFGRKKLSYTKNKKSDRKISTEQTHSGNF